MIPLNKNLKILRTEYENKLVNNIELYKEKIRNNSVKHGDKKKIFILFYLTGDSELREFLIKNYMKNMKKYIDKLHNLVNMEYEDFEEKMAYEVDSNNILSLIDFLSSKQRLIIIMRYGLNGTIYNLSEIADKLNISVTRVTQLESAALRRLYTLSMARGYKYERYNSYDGLHDVHSKVKRIKR